MAEKKAKESSRRDAAAGVALGGDRPKVMLAPVEELNAETEDWIWGHRCPLTSPAQRSLARERFLRPSDFECR